MGLLLEVESPLLLVEVAVLEGDTCHSEPLEEHEVQLDFLSSVTCQVGGDHCHLDGCWLPHLASSGLAWAVRVSLNRALASDLAVVGEVVAFGGAS